MYSIKTMNHIAQAGLDVLPAGGFRVGAEVSDPDGILVRSASLHEMELNSNLRAIARAGAGTNNIPLDKCAQAGVVVFNTPGANANAVKELALAALLMASRNLVGGAAWVREQAAAGVDLSTAVEKGKSVFAGPEIMGKTLGVVGLGAIGVLVANAAYKLGMEVYGYDPYLSVETALRLDRHVHCVKDENELWEKADYITLHLPYSESTKDTINAGVLARTKPGVRVINLARGGLVNEAAMVEALHAGKVARYVTDFPSAGILAAPNVVALPHLGASTPESELNCAVMAAQSLKEYLENGNIVHSVNYPDVFMDRGDCARVCALHRNIPNMLLKLTTVLSEGGFNIEHMTNKARGEYAYTLIDVSGTVSEENLAALKAVEGVFRIRLIQE